MRACAWPPLVAALVAVACAAHCPNNCTYPRGVCDGSACRCFCLGEDVCFSPPDCLGEYDPNSNTDYIDCHGGLWGGDISRRNAVPATEEEPEQPTAVADSLILPGYVSRQTRYTDRYCICPEGWTGNDCSVCMSNSSCRNRNYVYYETNSSLMCDNSVYIYQEKYFSCLITTPEVQNLLQGNGSCMLSCVFPNPAVAQEDPISNGTCYIYLGVDPKGPPLVFNCTHTECTRTIDVTGLQTVACAHTACNGSDYIDAIEDLVTHATGAMRFTCHVDGSCSYWQENLEAVVPQVDGICLSGECYLGWPPKPPLPPRFTEGQIATFFSCIGVAVFVVFVAIALFVEHQLVKRVSFTELDKYPSTLSFRDVSCTIPMRISFAESGKVGWVTKSILDGVSGVCHPGQLTAIIGASGSGKTTLLDILAGRKNTGKVSGEVLVNGQRRGKDFRRVSGYVTQDDVMLGTQTCREHLEFAANLRLPPSLSYKEKMARVAQVLAELELVQLADSFVGTAHARGISGGEKKRLNIATELMIAPSIIFLDEPTSGLDSGTAFSLVQTLKHIAQSKRRNVIMSVHQPSSSIFELFDQVLVLAHGHAAYFGSAADMVDHFTSRGFPCPTHHNPADFVIDLVKSEDNVNRLLGDGDDTRVVGSPPLMPSNSAAEKEEEQPLLGKPSAECAIRVGVDEDAASSLSVNTDEKSIYQTHVKHYSSSFVVQFYYLSKRTFLHVLRDPFLVRCTYLLYLAVSLILGLLYWQMSNDLEHGGIQDRFGVIFFLICLISFGSVTSIDLFFTERQLFLRERANGYYRTSAYFFSKALCDLIPQRVIPPAMVACIIYHMVGLRCDELYHFLLFVLVLLLVSVVATTICLCVSSVINSVATGNFLMILLLFYSLLFGGFIVMKSAMPKYVHWLTYASFMNYGFEALSVSEFDGQYINFNPSGYSSTPINGRELLDNMGIDSSNMLMDVYLLSGMAGGFTVLGYLLLKFYVKERR
eukprot:TRINITY_DN8200_c0_g1_i5.p1 TRINITY_DN8200_c0_g1~~TRINITY_DN8200_c0_g1_i5.p1  ORF type:complete len:989 (-),score=213.88 TRINITY_DN8200_c0_g1_i5:94-3060(-)